MTWTAITRSKVLSLKSRSSGGAHNPNPAGLDKFGVARGGDPGHQVGGINARRGAIRACLRRKFLQSAALQPPM
jgi:hypothetical protein